MRFSGSFIVFLFVALSLLIIGNIASMIYYAPGYFNEYVEDVRKQIPSDESALIDALIESKDLDQESLAEYQVVLQDLRELTKSLEDFSEAQRIESNTQNNLRDLWFTSPEIEQTVVVRSIRDFLNNIVSIALSTENTPERVFLIKILTMLMSVNLVLISIILGITFLWTKFLFRATKDIEYGLSRLLDRKEYMPIEYKRRDEFEPLIHAVNSLSESLSIQEKIRSDFLSDFSHEIKTPITALKVYFEWIEDGIVSLDEKSVWIVQAELNRLLATTESIMEYEKVNAIQDKILNRSYFDLSWLLENLREEYTPILATHSQMISFEDKEYIVFLEKNLIIQLLHNVISNFSKYSGKGTTLAIRMTRRGRRLQLIFEDNGRGVDKENVKFLTEKFYQEDGGRVQWNGRGIWIGLSLVEKIAKKHDGFVAIMSDRNKWFRLKVVLDNFNET
jgi:two-component system, OmpR family, sensor histidine kinase BaeS